VQVDRVITALVERSAMSGRAISAALGKSSAYVKTAARAGRSPALATVADVADVVGVDVVLVDRETGATVCTVTPPRRADDLGDSADLIG
jgi:hypothetical protein